MEQVDHIQVADDDQEIREMVAAYLRKNALRAPVVADGREMRALLETTPVDLIVLDVRMPGDAGLMSCRNLCRRLCGEAVLAARVARPDPPRVKPRPRHRTLTSIKQEPIMATTSKVLYTAKTHTTGGREHGVSRSSDGHLDIKLSSPGSTGTGTNPEQLFAAGWSACFEGAMGLAARKMKIALPADTAIDAEVDLCLADSAYFLQARLNVSLPGLKREDAQALVDAADQTCPYSKAIRCNVEVVITVV
jgi:osmotically inducible protein OsmC